MWMYKANKPCAYSDIKDEYDYVCLRSNGIRNQSVSWIDFKRGISNGEVMIDDEFTVQLKDGQNVTFVCEYITDGHALFCTKDCLADPMPMQKWDNNDEIIWTIEDYLNNRFKKLLPCGLQDIIMGKIGLLSEKQVFDANKYGVKENDRFQLPRYKIEKNRIKYLNGKPYWWWLDTPAVSGSGVFCGVGTGGTAAGNGAYGSGGVAPCFWI